MEYRIGILLFDGVEPLDFAGPFEVFAMASRFVTECELRLFTIAEQSPVEAVGGLSVNAAHSLEDRAEPRLLIVPGGQGTRREMRNRALLEWLRDCAGRAELVLSVCTGALLLGAAGLLDGREATTHHGALDLLREVAPACGVVGDRRYVDDGKLVCAAGVAAGIDASLHVVARLFGDDVAQQTAGQMEYEWGPQ
jgi:transcriptional regulator GlxA family with amidase domain